MHTRIQLDVTATITVRQGGAGRFEVVILDGSGGDASAVLDLDAKQAYALQGQLADVPNPAIVNDDNDDQDVNPV